MLDTTELVKDIRRAVTAARDTGVVLDRVIGYGSYFWGNHVENESDIDIAVILASRDDAWPANTGIVRNNLGARRNLIDDFYVVDLFEIEKHRAVTTSMNGKILARGVPLYVNPGTRKLRERAIAKAPPYTVARDNLVTDRKRIATQMLGIALTARNKIHDRTRRDKSHLYRLGIQEAQAAAVFALWANLYAHDTDPSPKALRWDAGRLAMIAAMFTPELNKIIPAAKRIPVGRLFNSDRYDFTRRETLYAIQAAEEVCAALGVTAAPLTKAAPRFFFI